MPANRKLMRYAHSEGHTSLCFEETGRYLLTCGSDGDVRIWDGLEDDDPVSKHIGEMAHAITFKDNKFYVASEVQAILAYTFPGAAPDGTVTKFSAPVTHMVPSKDGKEFLAGSSDFSIKYVNLADHSFRLLLGHEAAVLSVALDPRQQYAASSSCDGTVRIWNLEKQTCIKSWASVLPSSNDVSASKVLCRIMWEPVNGKFLAVPMEKKVVFYNADKWDECFSLTDDSIKEAINVISFSACGRYIAAACLDGAIAIWNVESKKCIERLRHEKGITICSLEWNPNNKGELVFCDTQGQLGAFENVDVNRPPSAIGSTNAVDIDDDFPFLSDDDDENTVSISKIKADTVGFESFLDHDSLDASMTNKSDKARSTMELSKETNAFEDDIKLASTLMSGPAPSKLQEAFQPGSTPVHFPQRFMVWNSVGIVRSYNTDEENTIDVEFHDTAIHHSLHLENFLGHTMADISATGLILACQAQLEIPSKLVCLHFGSWDNSKEWTVDMPEGENIEAVAVSDEWVAVATNHRQLRLFSIGGIQRHVVSLPGPVVSMTGHADKLVVCYHRAMGIPGDQCMALMLVNLLNGKAHVSNHTLPLNPKSTLAWIGFTDEGTPCGVDSEGVVRMLANSFGDGWIQICNTKKHAKGKSDHSFVVGLSELQQQIRCIPCKGSRYPATLPHPTVTVLPFELPLCEIACEKSQLEEKYWRQSLLLETMLWLDESGFEVDEANSQKSKAMQKESLMKLFALACRSDREFRALELSKMMDSHQTVQLAIRYASQLKRMQLAQKLGQVAYEKMEVEMQEDVPRQTAKSTNEAEMQIQTKPLERPSSRGSEENSLDGSIEDDEDNPRTPVSHEMNDLRRSVLSSGERQNPFKTSVDRNSARGIHTLDTMEKSNLSKKAVGNIARRKDENMEKPVSKIKIKRQGQLFSKTSEKETNKMQIENNHSNSAPVISRSGYQLWLEVNREKLKLENADVDDAKLALMAVQAFKRLPNNEKQTWNEKARNSHENGTETTPPTTTKRKRVENEVMDKSEVQQKSAKATLTKTGMPATVSKSTSSKLTGFAFRK